MAIGPERDTATPARHLRWQAEPPGVSPQRLLRLYQAAARSGDLQALKLLMASLQARYFVQPATDCARRILSREPDNSAAIRTLAECAAFVGDQAAAAAHYETLLQQSPNELPLWDAWCRVMLATGATADAVHRYGRLARTDSPAWHRMMARLASAAGAREATFGHLQTVLAADPQDAVALKIRLKALLRFGAHDDAADLAMAVLTRRPLDTQLTTLAIAVLAQRAAGEPLNTLMDYDAILWRDTLSQEFSRRDLCELSDYVAGHPSRLLTPAVNSVRSGYRTGALLDNEHPLIGRLSQAIQACTERYLAHLRSRHPAHPLLVSTGNTVSMERVAVVLDEGGYVAPHNHLDRWISGVFYCTDVGQDGEGGQIEFGRNKPGWGLAHDPGIKTVAPRAGDLVLFPSYLIHRVLRYAGAAPRVSIAFNIWWPSR